MESREFWDSRKRKLSSRKKLHRSHIAFSFFLILYRSDPITQFAVAFSSIIHDLDHPGVPNAVLVKEETRIAKMYKDKSVAEQNSVDLAWSLLMEPRFKDLRSCIYKTQSELDRFRQLVVNSVMATVSVLRWNLYTLRPIQFCSDFSDWLGCFAGYC